MSPRGELPLGAGLNAQWARLISLHPLMAPASRPGWPRAVDSAFYPGFLSEFAWATPSGPQKLYKNWTFPLPETSCAAVNPG